VHVLVPQYLQLQVFVHAVVGRAKRAILVFGKLLIQAFLDRPLDVEGLEAAVAFEVLAAELPDVETQDMPLSVAYCHFGRPSSSIKHDPLAKNALSVELSSAGSQQHLAHALHRQEGVQLGLGESQMPVL
jgi:hypothetical protein